MHFAVVSYTFPPSKEIGGRRWAKLSQYLSELGQDVTVITTDMTAEPSWYEKEFPRMNFKFLPKKYPDWLDGYTKSFKEKLFYSFTTRVLKSFTKQNFFDRGFRWEKAMLDGLEELHSIKKIDVLVVTGAPFSLLYYGAKFKKRHKDIFYVIDFRDPWTWGSYYGMPYLSPRKKKFQELSERSAMETCDMACFPTEHMGNFLKKKYPDLSSKLYLLPHAYDPNKFPPGTNEENKKGFVYGGTLYKGIDGYLKKISEVLKANPGSDFKWTIYTGTHYPILDDTNFTQGQIIKKHFVPEEKLFQEIKNSSAYLAIFPETDKDLVSTKFFEIIYAGTPILYIGEEGDVGRFIRENRVGIHILPANIEKDFPQYLGGVVPFEKGYFDVTQYSFNTVTSAFLNAVKNFKKLKP